MLLGYVGYYLCRGNLAAAFPLMSQAFGYSNSQLGLIAFYSEAAYALGKFVNGPLADRWNGRSVFLVGMAGAIVFNVAFAQASHLWLFILIWCGCRYFLSMGWGGLVKVVGNWYEPERNGTIMGVMSINFQFGAAVASLFAGWLVSRGAVWSDLFLYPAGVLSLVWVGSFLASRDSPQDVAPGTQFGRSATSLRSLAAFEDSDEKLPVQTILRTLWGIPLFRDVLVFAFLTTLLRSIFLLWAPKFLVDIGMGKTAAILNSALFPLLGCIGTIFLGWYTDRYARGGDRARMMWIMLVGLVLCLLRIAWLIPSGPGHHDAIVILTGLSGFFLLGPYSMSAGALTLDIAGPKGAGSCAGWVDGVGYFGGALAAWGAGRLSDVLGWSQVFYILAVFAGLSVLEAHRMSLHYRRKAGE